MMPLGYLGIGAAIVAVWYWSDWERARRAGRELPLLVHPLALVAIGARRLWQERAFLRAIVIWLLVISAVRWGVSWPLLEAPRRTAFAAQAGMPPVGPGGQTRRRPAVTQSRNVMWPGEGIGLVATIQQNLERLEQNSFSVWEAVGQSIPGQTNRAWQLAADPISSAALTLFLIMVLFRFWRTPPDWLGPRAARQVPLLLAITAGGFVLQVATTICLLRNYGGASWYARAVLNTATTLVVFVHLMAYGFLWHCLFQIVRRGRCSYLLAIRTGLVVWLPMVVFYAVTKVPTLFMQSLPLEAIRFVPLGLYSVVITLLSLAMLLVPWLIVQRRMSFLGALSQELDLLAASPRVILPFVLRTTLVFVPLQLLAALLDRGGMLASTLQLLITQLTMLLALSVVALWLLELEKQARRPLEANEGIVPEQGFSVE